MTRRRSGRRSKSSCCAYRPDRHATACVRAYHAAPHAWSVSFFARSLRDASGSVPRISQLLRMETLRDDMQRFVTNTSLDMPRCTSLLRSDHRQEKKAKRILPSSRVLHRMLRSEPVLAHLACRIYAQDFVCFGYEVPAACLSLFPLEPNQGVPRAGRRRDTTRSGRTTRLRFRNLPV